MSWCNRVTGVTVTTNMLKYLKKSALGLVSTILLLVWSQPLVLGLVSTFCSWSGLNLLLLVQFQHSTLGLVSTSCSWSSLNILLLVWSQHLAFGLGSTFTWSWSCVLWVSFRACSRSAISWFCKSINCLKNEQWTML